MSDGSLTTYDQHRLNLAVQPIRRAFGGRTYLVGSAQQRRDARDVDVRTIVDDDTWDALFAPFPHLWELLCIGMTAWLREQTGLPIDYQIQRMTEANEQHPDGYRSALGLGQNNPDHLYAGGGDASRWPQRGASSAPCFCGHPDDRERVHRAHACEPWTQRGARS